MTLGATRRTRADVKVKRAALANRRKFSKLAAMAVIAGRI